MVQYSPGFGAFEFVILSSLRAAQLTRGCAPRLPTSHKHVVTAQLEIAGGMVVAVPAGGAAVARAREVLA